MLEHCDAEYAVLEPSLPLEYSRGRYEDGIPRNSDGNPNLLGTNRNDDAPWLNAYYDNPDNTWNRKNGFAFARSQLSLFPTLHLVGGSVLSLDLTVPSSKAFPHCFKWSRNRPIFLGIKRGRFPKHHE